MPTSAEDETLIHPRDIDIIVGRGGIQHRPGNIWLRQHVEKYKQQYQQIRMKKEKTVLVESILEGILASGKKFYKKDSSNNYRIVGVEEKFKDGHNILLKKIKQLISTGEILNNTTTATNLCPETQSRQEEKGAAAALAVDEEIPSSKIAPMEQSDRDLIRFNAEQCAKLSFPIGCPVWYNFAGKQGTSLKRGVVKSAALRSNSQLVYEITYSDNNENTITEVVEDKQLGFGSSCPVTISSANSDDINTSLEGEIVLCTPSPTNASKFVYSAMIFLEGSRMRYEHAIEEERVTYRKLNGDDVDLAENNGNQSCHEKSAVLSKQSGSLAATPPPTTENQRLVPTSIRVGQDANSVDSSRKRPRDEGETKVKMETTPRMNEQPDLEIPVPLWLQKDHDSQRKLFEHLLGKSDSGRLGCNMKRISEKSQCKIAVVWDGEPMVIKIFAKNSKGVLKSKLYPFLQKARLMIRDLFLEFVGNDGSRGRLVYEIAKSCWGPHRPKNSTSNAVNEINPLHTDRSLSYLSVVDIPNDFVREGKHHQLHMALVGSMRDSGCKMDIVADGFTHTTKLCDPYVLVYALSSTKAHYVDRAVRMVEDNIRQS